MVAEAGAPRALVTGASSGIGEAFARALAKRGRELVIVARRAERLQKLAAELGGGNRVAAIPLDLLEKGAPERLEAELRQRGLTVDLLVNNAGVGVSGKFLDQGAEKSLGILDLNVRVVLDLTRRFLPPMVERHSGAVINVVSMAAFQPVPYMAVYAGSKAFLLLFTEALVEELRGTGVTVQALCPGNTRTEFQEVAGTAGLLYDRTPAMTAEAVVRASLAALDRGRSGPVIPGLLDRVQLLAQSLTPRRLVTKIAGELFRPR